MILIATSFDVCLSMARCTSPKLPFPIRSFSSNNSLGSFPIFFSIIFLTEIGPVKAPKKQWSKVRCAECRTESWEKSRKTWNVKNSFLSVQFSLVKTKVNLWTKNCGFGADYSRVWLAIIGSKIELKDFLFAKSHFMTVCSVLITHRALFAFLMRKSWNNESYGNMVLAESMRFSTG